MSPAALGSAVLLHGLVALALWWMALDQPQIPSPSENPITVTIEQPKPQDPPREPPLTWMGLPPPAPVTADKPTQVPPKTDQPIQERPRQAFALPPPPPPATVLEFPQPALPNPPPKQPPSLPSPLTTPPRSPPPAVARSETPSPSPLVNPADARNRARVADNYLWEVARKLSGYRYKASAPVGESLTVVRVTIARDGRLLAIDVVRSSGFAVIDAGVVAGVRAGSPYAPLPPEIQGASASFNLPLISTNRQ